MDGNNSVFLLLLILVVIWAFWYCSNKSNLYQGASMSGVWEGPMADGPSGGMVQGGQSGGDLHNLNNILMGRSGQQF
jgi:hypothetical protein